ncbi:phosphate acyltransferase PlsX [Magnetospira sp. QH-2]|uniref:phosphate acyltransferase PlsX n=1 Tax=Magnetospira sp. (strain QH-2) TaxID=1288970 RepID=UPI0003E81066|nr:phosphate acyltransferase PlsX [Magnetospira sp. QH-2]CCQ73818.1 Fatty acid/phospholipid synthesis protein, methyltransferase domain [Magnetospira sp. QH-2]
MNAGITLSIDAMGGDNAPDMVIEGLELAHSRIPDAKFLVFGDEVRLNALIERHPALAGCCEIRHAEGVITNEMKPSVALRSGRKSSMWHAIAAVKSQEADGIISAGNTGALMAMSMIQLRTLPGVSRPAIATYFPTQRGRSVMLDLGANVTCDAENLVQFAVMGEVFARQVLDLEQPSVGILNVGVEDLKGHEEVKQASALLQEANLPIKFHGFVEGDDIGAGTVDVIVTDGFTGNVALKTAEGTARMFGLFLREALSASLGSKLGALLAMPALKRFKQRVDPRRYNGAMFVGLNGICVKSHGGTDGLGFSNAIRASERLVRHGFNDRIKEDLERLMAQREREEPSIAAEDTAK